MYISDEALKAAIKSLFEFDKIKGTQINRYIGLIELSKICGEIATPQKLYTIPISKLTDSLNKTYTLTPTPASSSQAVFHLKLGENWHEEGVKLFLKGRHPPLLELATVCLRNKQLSSDTAGSLIAAFVEEYNIPTTDDGQLQNQERLQTSDSPVSAVKFIEICENVLGEKIEAKKTYAPEGFIAASAGEFKRGPYTQNLLNDFNVFNIVQLTETIPQNTPPKSQEKNVTFLAPERNVISSRLISALAAKPFVILAGGTGTGKTRSARQVAIQIAGKENVNTVAVGADWTDNRPLLGFRNLLSPDGASYVAPEALKLILKADKNLRDADKASKGVGSSESSIEVSIKPFFLILDEMNLSHVERYFADFLSSMESGEALKLHDYQGELKADGSDLIIPREVEWPRNLFVIGTVNIDETTYMFSPKVLDRAHVIEFKVSWNEIKTGLSIPPAKALASWSTEQTQNFTNIALDDKKVLEKADQERLENVLAGAYGCLEGSRYNFAHRTARECLNYVAAAQRLSEAKLVEHRETTGLIDLAILQKALPKLNGSAGSLTETLNKLSVLTTTHALKECSDKLSSMIKQLKNDQFVSFIQ